MRETRQRITGTVFPSFYLFIYSSTTSKTPYVYIFLKYELCFISVWENTPLPADALPFLNSEQSNHPMNYDFFYLA